MKITFTEAKYLKHAGSIIDMKVSVKVLYGVPVLHIMDCEFRTFAKALAYIQNVLPSIVEIEEKVVLS